MNESLNIADTTESVGGSNAAFREASGSVSDQRPAVAFFYELMRDHMTPGMVEEIMLKLDRSCTEWHFTNGWLANHAQSIVERLAMRSHDTNAADDEAAA